MRLVFFVCLAAIVILALYPDLQLPRLTPSGKHSDFVYHLVAFLFLTIFATRTNDYRIVTVGLMIGFAVALELMQAFVPGRRVFMIDAVASLLGVLLGATYGVLTSGLRRRWFLLSRHS